ncbi:hypothetical protein EC973_001359 [Apophysomyces ossiformis]|uniref:Uncharacterized protein n=1 Tax=Apophysomyces ossiformis TaxID=679940 RepID=A0A8H7BY08_9FUNG|nr:hypothetical protein EC973_001359 [Apophysomyces ossiformis]
MEQAMKDLLGFVFVTLHRDRTLVDLEFLDGVFIVSWISSIFYATLLNLIRLWLREHIGHLNPGFIPKPHLFTRVQCGIILQEAVAVPAVPRVLVAAPAPAAAAAVVVVVIVAPVARAIQLTMALVIPTERRRRQDERIRVEREE